MVEVTLHPTAVSAAVAFAVAIAVRTEAVRLSSRVVLAAAPWAVAAAGVVVAARAGVYDVVTPTPSVPRLLGVVAVLAVIGWLGNAQLAALRDVPHCERYLAAGGLGAAAVVILALFSHVGGILSIRLILFPVAFVVAATCAALGYFVLGLVYTDALVELRLAGLYAVGVVVLDGSVSATAVEAFGYAEVGIVTAAIAATLEAGGVTLSTWTLLPIHTLAGVGGVGVCGWLARRRPRAGYGSLLVGSVLIFGATIVVLLSAVLLG